MTPTLEDWNRIMFDIVGGMTTAHILSYNDVYAAFTEILNNDILELWEAEQAELYQQHIQDLEDNARQDEER